MKEKFGKLHFIKTCSSKDIKKMNMQARDFDRIVAKNTHLIKDLN